MVLHMVSQHMEFNTAQDGVVFDSILKSGEE